MAARGHHQVKEAIMNRQGDTPYGDRRDDSRADSRGTVRLVPTGRGQVRVRKSSSRKLRDLPELDLRTPSGRILPF